MKKLLFAGALAVAALAGCGTFTVPGSTPVDPTLSPLAQAAEKTLHEAYIAVGASADVLLENYEQGIVTPTEFVAQRVELRRYLNAIDKAQELFDECLKKTREPEKVGALPCDFTEPQRQAEVTMRVVTALHKKLAERRRALQ